MKKVALVFIAVTAVCGAPFLFVYALPIQLPSPTTLKKVFPADSYNVFTKSARVMLYSLESEKRIEGKELFHGYSVLGKTEVRSPKLQAKLKSSFVKAMPGAYGAACFNPRHGLRLVDGEKTVDLVICFECGTTVTYYGEAKGEGDVFGTPARLYNRVLREAGVEITKN